MSKRLWCSLLTVLLCGTQQARGDDPKWKDDKLQGTWQAAEVITNGEPLPEETLQRLSVEISGENLRVHLLGADDRPRSVPTFRVNSSKRPKTIDVYTYDMTQRGIYEMDADTLKLCWTNGPRKERPTEFAAPKESGLTLLILQRIKEQDERAKLPQPPVKRQRPRRPRPAD